MAHLENVEITPNPVKTEGNVSLCVTISTYGYLKNFSWDKVSAKKYSEVNSQWKIEKV